MKVSSTLLLFFFLIFQLPAPAAGSDDEHGVIKPMPRSVLVPAQSEVKNFASYQFRVQKDKQNERVEKKGKYWHLRYLIKDASGKVEKSIGREEIVRKR